MGKKVQIDVRVMYYQWNSTTFRAVTKSSDFYKTNKQERYEEISYLAKYTIN